MKLLYITNGITGAGGLERVLAIKASLLAENLGYEVHILSLNEEDTEPFFEFSPKIIRHSLSVDGNALQYIKMYRNGLQHKVKVIQPDVISVCDDGLKGFFIPRILGKKIPCIYERHVSKNISLDLLNANQLTKILPTLKGKLMNYLSNDFDAFVVLTTGNSTEWRMTNNLKVIPNPLSFFPVNNALLGEKKVIAVGKQSYQKSYDRLLQIWKQASEGITDWQLHIYGAQAASERLPELASVLGVQNTVFFHEPDINIEKRYLESSIFVLSSRYEGFGMVIIEAMSCGLPVVSFDCPHGPGDIISNKKNGFLVENGDNDEFATKLKLLMQDENLRRQFGACGKQSVKKYVPEIIVKEWDELFKHVKKLKNAKR